MLYLILIIGLLLAAVNEKKFSPKLYVFLLMLTASLRYGLGADYFSYNYLYLHTYNSVYAELVFGYGHAQEPGYRAIAAFCRYLNLSYGVFLAVIAVITLYFIYKLCVKYAKNPTLALVVFYACYYFVWSLSALRQGIVISIGLYFLMEAVKDKKIIKFIIVTLILSLIHYSALLLFVFYVVSLINFKKWHLAVILLAAILFNLIPLKEILENYNGSIYIFRKLASYAAADNSPATLFQFSSLARLAFLMIAFVVYDVYCADNPFNKRVMNMYILSFAIYFVFKFSELTAARLAIYGKVLDILIFTNVFYYLKRKDNKIVYAAFLAVLIGAYFFKELNTMEFQSKLVDQYKYFTPYVNIFNKDNFTFIDGLIELIE